MAYRNTLYPHPKKVASEFKCRGCRGTIHAGDMAYSFREGMPPAYCSLCYKGSLVYSHPQAYSRDLAKALTEILQGKVLPVSTLLKSFSQEELEMATRYLSKNGTPLHVEVHAFGGEDVPHLSLARRNIETEIEPFFKSVDDMLQYIAIDDMMYDLLLLSLSDTFMRSMLPELFSTCSEVSSFEWPSLIVKGGQEFICQVYGNLNDAIDDYLISTLGNSLQVVIEGDEIFVRALDKSSPDSSFVEFCEFFNIIDPEKYRKYIATMSEIYEGLL